jgi:hypothetical protein
MAGASVSYRLQEKHMKWAIDGSVPLSEKRYLKPCNFLLILKVMVYMKMLILRCGFQKQESYILSHHHHPSRRPNQYRYGKNGGTEWMVSAGELKSQPKFETS